MNKFKKIIKSILFKADMPAMKKYEIEVKMVNSNVVKMDIESFRKSKAVKLQAKAAKRSIAQVNV